jgi:hypothetical protein
MSISNRPSLIPALEKLIQDPIIHTSAGSIYKNSKQVRHHFAMVRLGGSAEA